MDGLFLGGCPYGVTPKHPFNSFFVVAAETTFWHPFGPSGVRGCCRHWVGHWQNSASCLAVGGVGMHGGASVDMATLWCNRRNGKVTVCCDVCALCCALQGRGTRAWGCGAWRCRVCSRTSVQKGSSMWYPKLCHNNGTLRTPLAELCQWGEDENDAGTHSCTIAPQGGAGNPRSMCTLAIHSQGIDSRHT